MVSCEFNCKLSDLCWLLKKEANKKKVLKDTVGFYKVFILPPTVRWWNLSAHRCSWKVDSLPLAEALPRWHCTSCS